MRGKCNHLKCSAKYIPQGITLGYSVIFLHDVFMCFILLSKQTMIIPINRNNRLVFIIEAECFLCEVGTEDSHTVCINCWLQRLK